MSGILFFVLFSIWVYFLFIAWEIIIALYTPHCNNNGLLLIFIYCSFVNSLTNLFIYHIINAATSSSNAESIWGEQEYMDHGFNLCPSTFWITCWHQELQIIRYHISSSGKSISSCRSPVTYVVIISRPACSVPCPRYKCVSFFIVFFFFFHYCTISFNLAVTHHAPPPEHQIVTLVTLILARCWKVLAKSISHILNYPRKFIHDCWKKKSYHTSFGSMPKLKFQQMQPAKLNEMVQYCTN